MNRLDELIKELCPNGVRYAQLGTVCDVLRGKRLTKAQLSDDGKYPVLHGGLNPMGYYSAFNRKAGTTIVVNTGNAGSVFYSDKEFWSSDACFSLYPHSGLTDRYLFHFVLQNEPTLKGKVRAGAMPTIDALAVESLRIPLPPLPVQQEIVRILDNFTELTAELTAELAARRKQYEHYRDELLTFGDDVPEATLGDICDFKYGKGNNIPTEHGNYPVYGCNGVVATTNTFNSEDAPVIGHIGSAGIVNWGAGKHYVTYNGTICNVKSDKMISRYAYHLLCSLHLERFVKGSQPFLSYGDFSKETVSVPPIEKQQRIVTILDRFDTLCNDLTSGLPAEIAARQKQYEYYRDKLLTFKEL